MDIAKYLAIPFVKNGADWKGCDCAGLIELVYAEELGIAVDDRQGCTGEKTDLVRLAAQAENWFAVDAPKDFDVVMLRSTVHPVTDHCGLVHRGHVLHMTEQFGPIYQPIADRQIAARIRGYRRHVGCA